MFDLFSKANELKDQFLTASDLGGVSQPSVPFSQQTNGSTGRFTEQEYNDLINNLKERRASEFVKYLNDPETSKIEKLNAIKAMRQNVIEDKAAGQFGQIRDNAQLLNDYLYWPPLNAQVNDQGVLDQLQGQEGGIQLINAKSNQFSPQEMLDKVSEAFAKFVIPGSLLGLNQPNIFQKANDLKNQFLNASSNLLDSNTIEIKNNKPNLSFTPKDPSLLDNGKSIDTIIDKPAELNARAVRNNNPTNLHTNQGRTIPFKNPEEGIRAAYSDLTNKLSGQAIETNRILKTNNITDPTIGDILLAHVIGKIDYNNLEGKKYLADIQHSTGIPAQFPVKDLPKELYYLLLKGMMREESTVFFKRYRNLVDSL